MKQSRRRDAAMSEKRREEFGREFHCATGMQAERVDGGFCENAVLGGLHSGKYIIEKSFRQMLQLTDLYILHNYIINSLDRTMYIRLISYM